MRNKNEGCQELNDPLHGSGCRFYNGVNKIKTHDKLSNYGIQPAWDIEDLVTMGKKIVACPYYSARSLKETAEVIFCPYNYLVDPIILDTMNISLKDQIIVLDEAHNIEESARESTSTSLKEETFMEAIQDLNKIIELKYRVDECKSLSDALTSLLEWMNLYKDNLTDYKEFDRSGKIFTGTEMVAHLGNLQIGPERFAELERCQSILTADQDPENDNPRLKMPTIMTFKALFLMFQFLFMENMKYCDDYRVAIVRLQARSSGKADSGGYYSKKRSSVSGWEYSLNFWCLNPGIAFMSIGKAARSVILTSGTLSPMNSFQSELGIPFQIQLEANHVIDKKQVWVGTLARGPSDQALLATFRNTETWEFQDELGRLVLNICKVIPRGVLCFVPSYSMLNKLVERWQATGIWDQMGRIKVLITEPRKGDEFESAMNLFYDTIRDTKDVNSDGCINGAYFMAVCRGKVSEGLDFTDDNARAVISIGIPFPSLKDIQVDLKRKYNNHHCKTRGLLNGTEWYEIQAYRALNQALGRCIRHRYDWGALILVDERFQQGSWGSTTQQTKYTRGLSKWVRNKIVHFPKFDSAISHLHQFAENMTSNPPQRPESLDESLLTQTNSKEEASSGSTKSDGGLSVGSPAIGTPLKFSDRFNLKSSVFQPIQSPSQNSFVPNSSQLEEVSVGKLGGLSTSVIDNNVPFSTQILGAESKLASLSTSVIESEDADFCSGDESLILPQQRIPITSTQISGQKEAAPFISLTQDDQIEQEAKSKLNCALAPLQSLTDSDRDQPLLKCKLQEVPTCGKSESLKIQRDFNSSPVPSVRLKTQTKRKSFSLHVEGTKHNVQSNVNAALRNDECKVSVEEDCKGSETTKSENREQKNSLKVDSTNENANPNDSNRHSPDLFDSDEENIPGASSEPSPKKVEIKKSQSKRETPRGTPSNARDNTATYRSGLNIKNFMEKVLSKKVKNELDSNDSDLDDFCLEKSFSTPKSKKMKKE